MRGETTREKRQFKRNYDSGIWMGSEGTESSLEDEFLIDQRKPDAHESFLREVTKDTGGVDLPEVSPPAAAENVYLASARVLVQQCVDAGTEDLDLS